MDLEPGRIGFMSTQRRESHSTPTTEDRLKGLLRDWRSSSDTACAENDEQLEVARTALQGSSLATALESFRFTCRHLEVLQGGSFLAKKPLGIQVSGESRIENAGTAPNWEATNSLHLDSCTSKFVELFVPEIRRGSLPVGNAGRVDSSLTASRRSSLPLMPDPPVLEHLHPALPQFPAAKGSRTERYDGKRDLHLQHAA
jgi:hypothetical protein